MNYSDKLYNADLAPATDRHWSAYAIAAMWMTFVHSVGGYLFAAGLFNLGLSGWQVLTSLIVGIILILIGMNLVGRISQTYAIPFPVAVRISFGVFGAQIPATIRGLIGILWYGIQTWLASVATSVLLLRLFPVLAAYTHSDFLGLSALGWACFAGLWLVQLLLFYCGGIEGIRRFADWAGPAIYIIMLLLAVWLIRHAGIHNISLSASTKTLSLGQSIYKTLAASTLVIAYFATLLINFGDFARFTPTLSAMKKGNFWGLPINFTLFAIVTVLMTSSTVLVFGKQIVDPIEIVSRIPNTAVLVVGALTFIIATIGINVVANFLSPAYVIANMAPKHIDFRRGGLIAAVISILVMPWKIYQNPVAVTYFLSSLGAFLGPIFAIMIIDFYWVKKQQVQVDQLYQASADSVYWYQQGFNLRAILCFLFAAAIAIAVIVVPAWKALAPFSWFIGAITAGISYYLSSRCSLCTLTRDSF